MSSLFNFIEFIFKYERMMLKMPMEIQGYSVSAMSVNYAFLIEDGCYKFEKVKKSRKSDVALVLVLWGDEDLVTDPVYLEEAKKRIAEHEAENNQ